MFRHLPSDVDQMDGVKLAILDDTSSTDFQSFRPFIPPPWGYTPNGSLPRIAEKYPGSLDTRRMVLSVRLYLHGL